MTNLNDAWLDTTQLEALQLCLHDGSVHASQALAAWIGKPTIVELDTLEQCPLEQATDCLPAADEPICFCAAEMQGWLSGEMILAFDDASGLILADLLLDVPQGTTASWSDLAISAAEETTNILVCAYMNSLSDRLGSHAEQSALLPAPPQMRRDFAASLLQCAFVDQAMARDQVILARTRFEIAGTPVHWSLLFIPDAQSMERLRQWLPATDTNEA